MDGTMVADAAVTQHRAADSFGQNQVAITEGAFCEGTHIYLSAKASAIDTRRIESVLDLNFAPILGAVTLTVEQGHFFCS